MFLVRKSRTLRNLKGLALIKSTYNSLKSFISSEIHFDFDALSQKAMELLLNLDSIQVNDSWVFVILFKVQLFRKNKKNKKFMWVLFSQYFQESR